MCRRISILTGLLLFVATHAVAQEGPLDLIPEDADAAIAIRNLDQLQKKGDKFIADAQLNLPLRPSQFFDLAYQFLGVGKGVDRTGSAAVVLMNPGKGGKNVNFNDIERLLIGVLPFTDPDEMAAHFKIPKGMLRPNKVVPGKAANFAKFFAATPKHVYLGKDEKVVERAVKGGRVATELLAEQRRAFNDADVLIHVGAYAWRGPEGHGLFSELERELLKSYAAEEEKTVREFVTALGDARHVLAGIRLDGGLGMSFHASLPKGGNAVKLLKDIRAGAGASNLNGLPEGRVIAAQAFSGEGRQSALFAKVLFEFLLRETLERRKIVSPLTRPNFAGVFQELWQRLKGSRLAVYLTPDESRLGLFSLVAVLDAEDAGKFLREVKTLAKIADGTVLDLSRKDVREEIDIDKLIRDLGDDDYGTRQSANTRIGLIGEPSLPYMKKYLEPGKTDLETKRRLERLQEQISLTAAERRKGILNKDFTAFLPTFAYVPKAETRMDMQVDVVQIKLESEQKAAAQSLRQLLGPDWDKLRLAFVGNQIVVLLGSETALFDTALMNVKTQRPGLAASKSLANFQTRTSAGRLVELHVSLEALFAMTATKMPGPLPAEPVLTSVGLNIGADHVQLEMLVPPGDVRTILNAAVP